MKIDKIIIKKLLYYIIVQSKLSQVTININQAKNSNVKYNIIQI